jgi:hypothetical protein
VNKDFQSEQDTSVFLGIQKNIEKFSFVFKVLQRYAKYGVQIKTLFPVYHREKGFLLKNMQSAVHHFESPSPPVRGIAVRLRLQGTAKRKVWHCFF